ncbi:MAG: polysaccharide deacetylase family protein [Flavobacteriaceae bacterium]|nr:polysaccharide deacetylase family protein [Flavobacteriaceae bacterium]
MKNGVLVISLDFELMWGSFDHSAVPDKKQYFTNTLYALPKLLDSLVKNQMKATWATVGMLMNDNWDEWSSRMPSHLPTYHNQKLNSYEFGFEQRKEGYEKFFFAPSFVRNIVQADNQELGTHTYAHYYCLEPGQNSTQFKADLELALKMAQKFEVPIRSLVFPKNQVNTQYLEECSKKGITTVRSNPNVWYWNMNTPETLFKKIIRTSDAYIPLRSHSYPINSICNQPLTAQPASRFFRPQHRFELLNRLRLDRIKNEIMEAAKKGHVYHLWWHPHNFGIDPKGSLKALEEIIWLFLYCKETYGMQSKMMKEINPIL